MSIIGRIKRWLIIGGMGYGAYAGLWAVNVARHEPAPTRLSAADFNAGLYRGQQWLNVSGIVRPDEVVTSNDVNGHGNVDAWVPLHDDTAGPVHVLVLLGPTSGANLSARLSSLPNGPAVFTGSRVFFDAEKICPNVAKAGPVVMLQADNAPMPAATAWTLFGIFGAICLLALTFEARAIYRAVQDRR